MDENLMVPAATSRAARLTVGEAIEAFAAGYAGRDGTLPSRLLWWKARLGSRPLAELDAEAIDAALAALAAERATYYAGKTPDGRPIFRDRGRRSGATVNRYRCALASLLKFARQKRLVPRGWPNPLAGLDREAESPGRLRYLSREEYRRLLAAAKVSRWPKLHLLVRLAVESGARRGALLGLRWRDLDLAAGKAIVERTKNGTPHVIVLLPGAIAELKRFAAGRPPEELVFASRRRAGQAYDIAGAFRRALAGARIQGASFHTLRHTHASWLASQGASLLQIAESMNHRSLAMVKRYAHLCVEDRARLVARVFAEG